MYSAAERWYRRAMEKAADHYQPLARSLAFQGRYEEALRLCEDAAAKDSSSQPFVAAAYVMLEGRPSAKDLEHADAFLAKAAERSPDQPELLSVLAALRIQESRLDEAVALLRRVIELRPRDVVAKNNLATVLAEQPDKLAEGKLLLDQAIALAGPQPGLVDLKGVILIGEGKPREAIPLLEEVCAAPRTDPRYCFHAAVAYQPRAIPQKPRKHCSGPRGLNLDQQVLTPGDRKMLAELEEALTRKAFERLLMNMAKSHLIILTDSPTVAAIGKITQMRKSLRFPSIRP